MYLEKIDYDTVMKLCLDIGRGFEPCVVNLRLGSLGFCCFAQLAE